MKVLIADKNKEYLNKAKQELEKKGFEVDTVFSASAALNKLLNQYFDLVIIEKDLNAFDFIERIKNEFLLPIIVTTNYYSAEILLDALEIGAYSVLDKFLFFDYIDNFNKLINRQGFLSIYKDKKKNKLIIKYFIGSVPKEAIKIKLKSKYLTIKTETGDSSQEDTVKLNYNINYNSHEAKIENGILLITFKLKESQNNLIEIKIKEA